MSAYPAYWQSLADRMEDMERTELDAERAIEHLFEQGEWQRLFRLQQKLNEILVREAAE